jgi:glycine/sarcosine N-methyltransferase
MYEGFSADYDRFVDWSARLPAELPFIERQLQAVEARRVLDAACGTGMHAVALAQRGYAVAGADLSAGMVEQARSNAATAGVETRFEVAGFGEMAHTFGGVSQVEGLPRATALGRHGPTRSDYGFDAVLCLGNSLPHLLTPTELAAALDDFAACLQPNGLLLIQNRNFERVLARSERWMEPQVHREGETEWLFLRFYDFEPDGTLTFNLVTLRREGTDDEHPADNDHPGGDWRQQIATTRLRPLHRAELTAALTVAGFVEVTYWGDMQGVSFDPEVSPNLVVTARWTA